MKEEYVLHVVRYFAVFSYPPSIAEIRTYLRVGVSSRELETLLRKITASGRLLAEGTPRRYTLPGNERFFALFAERQREVDRKLLLARTYIERLGRLPFVRMVAITGSVAAGNARREDDIDLFVVAEAGRMWTVRLFAVALAAVMGLKRSRVTNGAQDKVCLNLFFDLDDLTVPEGKRNEYVAHEVLQARPVVDRHATHARFLHANGWILRLFPNNTLPRVTPEHSNTGTRLLFRPVTGVTEWIAKTVQLAVMAPHRTTERITDHQLWFHPNDYERTVKKKITLAKTG
jgi:predicted nucleotidyltransferase